MNWQDLQMSDRSELMKLYLKYGITSLDAMIEHYNSFQDGGHLYQDGGPDDDKYSFLRREPEVAVADNTRVALPTNPIELAQARAEYEAQQRQATMIRAAQNQTQLRANTRTDSDRRHEVQRREKQAKLDATRAAQRDFMSLGRPNTESQQAAVIATPYIAETTTDYLKNNNIARDLGYFVPGISNVLMSQDANQQINNGQYGLAALSGLGALSPVVGLTPNFKSPARYTRPANQVGDWAILDYGRTESPRVTIQYQLSSRPTLQLTPTRSVEVIPNPTLQLGTTPRQAVTGRPAPLRLPEETASSRALEEEAIRQHFEDLAFNEAFAPDDFELYTPEEIATIALGDVPAPVAPTGIMPEPWEVPDIPWDATHVLEHPANGFEPMAPRNVPIEPDDLNLIHPQIKPLIRGAEIEKQLSKTGTISRKSLDAYIAKQGKYYQELMNDVLTSEFDDVDKINYEDFRNAVQKRVPEYNRHITFGWNDYGLHALKLSNEPKLATFTFETPGVKGLKKHYGGEPIGHSRTYTTKDEPNVLHVMESQSDWAQQQDKYTRDQKRLEQIRNTEEYKHGEISERDLDIYKQSKPLTTKELHMRSTYLERQIQENLRYAAEQGQSRMRYPTRETAAKIEGYRAKDFYGDEYDNLIKEYQDIDIKITKLRNKNLTSDPSSYQVHRQYMNELEASPEYREMIHQREKLRKAIQEAKKKATKIYEPEHETILKKYDAFPKQFQKLFGKKAEVRTVTDGSGNTWYEVDVPESYKDKTGQIIFSTGGLLSLGGLYDKN